jgi:hypothetical protein
VAVKPTDVYIESGAKRTFACAVEWPGWCRSGADEIAALETLVRYGRRYGRALARKKIAFRPPADVRGLHVVERLAGNATTDFGAPAAVGKADRTPLTSKELAALTARLEACWAEFDALAKKARGKALRTGPRGGGRKLDAIVAHAIGAEAAYVGGLGGRYVGDASDPTALCDVRNAFLAALAARARGEIPDRGPRGGIRWLPRFAIRRSGWHWLDHAWEFKDRME